MFSESDDSIFVGRPLGSFPLSVRDGLFFEVLGRDGGGFMTLRGLLSKLIGGVGKKLEKDGKDDGHFLRLSRKVCGLLEVTYSYLVDGFVGVYNVSLLVQGNVSRRMVTLIDEGDGVSVCRGKVQVETKNTIDVGTPLKTVVPSKRSRRKDRRRKDGI